MVQTVYQRSGRGALLILKLIVVPLAVLLLGITERVHGPRAAGWLSGFPVIAAPLLWFITAEHGAAFGAASARAAFFGLVPWLTFVTVYAWSAQRRNWWRSAAAAFAAWFAVAELMILLQGASPLMDAFPFAAALAAMWWHPSAKGPDEQRQHPWWRLAVRMIAGATMTVAVAGVAGTIGSAWSGTFTTFPVVGSIVAISNHVEHGKRAVQEAVAGMVFGIVSVEVFCFVLSLVLQRMSMGHAFALALAAAMGAHLVTWQVTRRIS